MENLFNYQFDFIKIKSQKPDLEQINWEMLNEHPTIKKAYTLDKKSGLYGKNFKLYLNNNGEAVIETSVPYLLNGHNYRGLSSDDLTDAIENLQDLLNIYLFDAEVLQFEYGCFATVEANVKTHIKGIKTYPGYDLKFSSSWMKMFGCGELNFKIYDAVKNAKSKKTFTLGNYPKGGLIKYELKVTNAAKHLKSKFNLEELCSIRNNGGLEVALHSHIKTIKQSNKDINVVKSNKLTLNRILYNSLKMHGQKTGIDAYALVNNYIDACPMTPSQKSKRRKAVSKLEEDYTQINK